MSGILSCSEMREAEAAEIARGIPALVLMERAGSGCAAVIAARIPAGSRVAVLIGPGNNGGDGYVIARLLADHGCAVEVFGVAPRSPNAQQMAKRWEAPVHPPDVKKLRQFAPVVLVDALFGMGVSRAVDEPLAALIVESRRLKGEGVFAIAVDMPSGYPCDGGSAPGEAFSADLTITFHALKPVHVLYPGRAACGEIIVIDIGLGADPAEPRYAANEAPVSRFRQPSAVTAHKYDHGHALVLAGGIEGVGGARLAARAALRVGAGLVTLGVPGSALLAHASRGPDALMVRRSDGRDGLRSLLADKRRNAIVIGPAYGVDEATREAVLQLLASGRKLVLDADALGSFAGEAKQLGDAIKNSFSEVVVTPHAGEFSRLFNGLTDIPHVLFQQLTSVSKFEQTIAAANLLGAVVVHKGADTVIASPDGHAKVNLNAPPWLGTAGSGDVLAGMIGGLLAQGFNAFDAACSAVWLHGEAGNAVGMGLIADDLPEALQEVWKRFS